MASVPPPYPTPALNTGYHFPMPARMDDELSTATVGMTAMPPSRPTRGVERLRGIAMQSQLRAGRHVRTL